MAGKGNKKRDIPSSNLTSWIEALKNELSRDPAPEGWFTIHELVKLTGIPRQTLCDRMRDKKIQRKRFMPRSGGRPALHYKMQ
jgi:hypothetical protein